MNECLSEYFFWLELFIKYFASFPIF
jgi:hypothetical protein